MRSLPESLTPTASPSSAIPAATGCRRSSMPPTPAAKSCAERRQSACRGDRIFLPSIDNCGDACENQKYCAAENGKRYRHDLDAGQGVRRRSLAAVDANLLCGAACGNAVPVLQYGFQLEIFRYVRHAVDGAHASKEQHGTADYWALLQNDSRGAEFEKRDKQAERDGEEDISVHRRPHIGLERRAAARQARRMGRPCEPLKIEAVVGPQALRNRERLPFQHVHGIVARKIEHADRLGVARAFQGGIDCGAPFCGREISRRRNKEEKGGSNRDHNFEIARRRHESLLLSPHELPPTCCMIQPHKPSPLG